MPRPAFLSADDLTHLGTQAKQWYEQSRSNGAEHRARRQENLAAYRGESPKNTGTGRETRSDSEIHAPIIGPRLDQRADTVMDTIEKGEPMYQVLHMASDARRHKAQEKWLDFALTNCGAKMVMRRYIKQAMIETTSVVRVTYVSSEAGEPRATHDGPFAGPIQEVIPIEQFFAYPASDLPLEELLCHGHLFEQSSDEVQSLMNKGTYYKADVKAMRWNIALAEDINFGGVNTSGNSDKPGGGQFQEGIVPMLDCITPHWHGKELKYVRLIASLVTGKVLYAEDWNHPWSPYTLVQMADEVEGLFAYTGPMTTLRDLQVSADAVFSRLLTNGDRVSNPAVAVQDSTTDVKKLDGYKKSGVLRSVQPASVMFAHTVNAIGQLLTTFQAITAIADSATKTSASMVGSSSGPNETATAEQIRFTAFQTATSGDVARYAPSLQRIGKQMLYWIKLNISEMKDVYAAEIADDPDMLEVSFDQRGRVILSGTKPLAMPEVQAAVTQQAIQAVTQLIGVIGQIGANPAVPPEVQTYLRVLTVLTRDMISQLPIASRDQILEMIPDPTSEAAAPAEQMMPPQVPPAGILPPPEAPIDPALFEGAMASALGEVPIA